MRILLPLLLAFSLFAASAEARSVFSPRHSGLEPPGGPKQAPMPSMGYTDAYGYGLTDRMPEERKRIHRPRPGAYGAWPKTEPSAPLPRAPQEKQEPVWRFR